MASDMDFYAVLSDEAGDQNPPWSADLRASVERIIGNLPAQDGAFAKNAPIRELLEHYGGSRDSNETITRRMLFLLEGDYLTNESEFKRIRLEIIRRYVGNTPADHQIAFYLLNDVIRYWRTMAVDYADNGPLPSDLSCVSPNTHGCDFLAVQQCS